MTKNKLLIISVCCAIFITSFSFAADAPTSSFESRVHDGHLCARGSAWVNAKNVKLNVSSKVMGVAGSYDSKIFENHDMRLTLKDSELIKGETPGEAILVAGRALLTKNIEIEENYAIDVLDGAALFQQLAFTLLELSTDIGPENIAPPFHKEIKESTFPIKANTQSASAYFYPPWNSVVDLKKTEDGSLSFEIEFQFYLEGGQETNMHFAGTLSNYLKNNTNQNLPDDFPISDWRQYNIGPYTKKMETGTIYDFGTTYLEKPYAKLGELRQYIQEKYK